MADLEQMRAALRNGYTYDDIFTHHLRQGVEPPARPSLGEIWTGTLDAPGRDAVTKGAGPIGEVILGIATGGLVGAARGAISGLTGDAAEEVAATLSSRAAGLGVQPSTEGLRGAMSAGDLAVENAIGSGSVVGSKPVGAAGAAAATYYVAMKDPGKKMDLFPDTPAPSRPSGPEDTGQEEQ